MKRSGCLPVRWLDHGRSEFISRIQLGNSLRTKTSLNFRNARKQRKTRRERKKHALYLSVNVFSTKVLIEDTIFTSPTGDRTTTLHGHPSHAKVKLFAGQRQYLHFSVILRPWVLVRSRESNPRPLALQSSALPTEPILPREREDCNSDTSACYKER